MENGEVVARVALAVIMIGAGVVVIWSARAAASGRLKRNQWNGIRLEATMASDEAWLVAHRAARRPQEWAGWCAIAGGACMALPVSTMTVISISLGAAGVIVALMLYAAVVGSQAARTLEREST